MQRLCKCWSSADHLGHLISVPEGLKTNMALNIYKDSLHTAQYTPSRLQQPVRHKEINYCDSLQDRFVGFVDVCQQVPR
jgi:hypothetical protein